MRPIVVGAYFFYDDDTDAEFERRPTGRFAANIPVLKLQKWEAVGLLQVKLMWALKNSFKVLHP